MQRQAVEIKTYARDNIKNYKTLNAPNQSMIRKVIREGRANGIGESDLLMYAKIAAHSGLDFAFDKESNAIRNSKLEMRNGNSSEAGGASPSPTYADGYYDASRNLVVINPEATRSAERLLIHELDHAIRKDNSKFGIRNSEFDSTKKAIEANYDEKDHNSEFFASYSEKMLTNKYTLEKLLEAEPSLKEKILSFFKGASADYADVPKLSGAAKKYYRTYKKLFDEFSRRNAENNAMEPFTNKNGSNVNENGVSDNVRTINGNNMSVSGRQYAGLADVESENDISWLNVAYDDAETKSRITKELHNKMISDGLLVKITDETSAKVKESYPDLQGMKKKERLPILKEKINQLKNNLRTFLNQLKGKNFEFEVNGDVLEAKLYNVGINEVLEKVTQEKAEMLYTTEEIFKNSKYLYSTPDYDGDPNVHRWNYFYSPVQIGEDIVGVRIAIRDMANPQESQIYNWGIKKDTSLDGIGRGKESRSSYDISSDVSINIIPQPEQKSNTSSEKSLENSSNKQFALPLDDESDSISGAEVMSWLKKPESVNEAKTEAKKVDKQEAKTETKEAMAKAIAEERAQMTEKSKKAVADAKAKAEAKAQKTIDTERKAIEAEKSRLKANYGTDRVYNEKSIEERLYDKVEQFKYLKKDVKERLVRELWLDLNESNGAEWRKTAKKLSYLQLK